MAKLLVIIGITGQQGSSVHDVFKTEPGWRIRGITRDPSKHTILQDQGVELVKADLNDQASLDRAFEGANAIFAMTTCISKVFEDPSIFQQAGTEGKHPIQIAAEREAVQGKNIVQAAAKQLATLDRLVVSTLSDPRKWSNGQIMDLWHFNGTATVVQYLKYEHPALAERTSYLQLGNFLTNWKALQPLMFAKQRDGSMVTRFIVERDAQKLPFTAPAQDAGHFVRALVLSDKAPAGTTMMGYRGERMRIESYAALWGKVNGKIVSYRRFTIEEAEACGFPAPLVSTLLRDGDYLSKYGMDGGDPGVKSAEDCGVDVSRLGSVEDWIRSEDWSSVL